MKIEIAHTLDEGPIQRLLAECGLPWEDITPGHLQHFLTLQDGDRLAGVVGVEVFGTVCLLRSLAVAAQYRGRGMASRLVEKAEEHARSLGVEAVYLLTTTAEGFFARRGYHRIERSEVPAPIQGTTEFQSLCPVSAVCMRKRLAF